MKTLGHVSAEERAAQYRQRGAVIWLTGLSGSGKSTLAYALERRLFDQGHPAFVLDGDNVRQGLSKDLGFSPADRKENVRRLGEVAAMFADAGLFVITAFISPYLEDRAAARATIGPDRFIEVYLDVPVDVCAARDPKGLYRRARAGEIAQFTGVSAPYQPPPAPEIALATGELGVAECVERILAHLTDGGFKR
jgi:adenylylsulfate kinase